MREAERSSAALAKAQEEQRRTEHMLKAKHEEVAAAMRRLKEQEKAGAGKGRAGGKDGGTGAGGAGPVGGAAKVGGNLRRWAEHEFNLGVVLVSCRSLLAATMAQRADLQARLNAVNAHLGEVPDLSHTATRCR